MNENTANCKVSLCRKISYITKSSCSLVQTVHGNIFKICDLSEEFSKYISDSGCCRKIEKEMIELYEKYYNDEISYSEFEREINKLDERAKKCGCVCRLNNKKVGYDKTDCSKDLLKSSWFCTKPIVTPKEKEFYIKLRKIKNDIK